MFLRNEGSIHRPRGLSVLYCPFSDGSPFTNSMAMNVALLVLGCALCLYAFPARDQLLLCTDSSQTQPRHFNRVARHLIHGIALVCFQSFSEIQLKSRTVAKKTPTKFLLKFVRDISTKDDTILFPCISFGPGFEYRVTARKAMDACRRHSSGRTTHPGGHSQSHRDDRRKLPALTRLLTQIERVLSVNDLHSRRCDA